PRVLPAENALLRDPPIIVRRSKEAYLRDLPTLLQDPRTRRQWVAYSGDKRVAIGSTETALYQECHKRGLRPAEFYIGMIVPLLPEPEIVDQPGTEFTERPA